MTLVEVQNTRMLPGIQTGKAMLMRLRMEISILLGIRQPYYTMPKNLPAFHPCPETLWDAELKGDRPVYLTEEISRQQSTQAVAWYYCLL